MLRLIFTLVVFLLLSAAQLLPACADDGVWIRDIHITGLQRTSPRTILRELPFSVGGLWHADSQAAGERRLRNLGLFSTVVILPPGEDGSVHVVLKERWSLFILPEASRSDIGKSTAGVTLTEHNLWGLHHQLRVAVREDTGKNFSGLKGTRADGSYQWRRVADGPVSLAFGMGAGRSVFDAFDQGVLTGQYQQQNSSWYTSASWALGAVPGDGWDLGLGFYSSRSTFRLVTGVPATLVQDSRRNSVLSTVTYTNLDDHTTWITGTGFQYALDVAHQGFGSTVNVYRQTSYLTHHTRLYSSTATLDWRISGGAASGQVLKDGLFDIGSNSGLRGYLPGELQGQYYLFGNIEGRFPLPAASNVQLVAFSDVGQIWSSHRPAFRRPVVAGFGGGARLTLRWLVKGTFRVDAAYGTATRRWRFYFGTGQAF
ncbi:hypothetical protein FE236_04100 [Mariprofundus erugo]|uniref:POTRA domain-containing protein n=1 Tax=Mariprofundus erugo TaxID=2528639 RepID=UPI0010FDF450|nr:POTRA domain-containing protein [Mariprofundus erugo]TLS77324.1 hypothetical protein FE236_04100 [Mariprofundus erugo]